MIRHLYFVLLLVFVSCGDNLDGASSLAIDGDHTTLEINERSELTATLTIGGEPSAANGTTWHTSDRGVVSFNKNSNGAGATVVIVGGKAGSATLTATNGELTATIDIRVNPAHVVRVEISPPGGSIAAGFTKAFTASATFSDDRVVDVTTQATWSVDDNTKISVDQAGVVTGKAFGDGIVTAAFGGEESSTHIVVTNATLQLITLSPLLQTIPKGVPVQYTATGSFSDGTQSNITNSVTWGSTVPGTATISNTAGTKGQATSVGEGDTTITAVLSLRIASTNLHVVAASVVSIAVSTNPAIAGFPTVPLTADVQFVATATLTDNSTIDITNAATWTSSVTGVATIDSATGFADARGVGQSTIKATQGAIEGVVDIDVQLAAVPAADFIAVAGYDTSVSGGFGGTPVVEGVRFSSGSSFLYVGSETGGFIRASADTTTNAIAFLAPPPEVTNLTGIAIAPHPTNNGAVMYFGDAAVGAQWARNNSGSGASLPQTDVFDTNPSGTERANLFAGRFENGVGAVLAGWDPFTGTAIVYAGGGNGTPPAVPTGKHAVGAATGTVRALTSSSFLPTGATTNMWCSVFDLQPDGVSTGTGGIFQSTDAGVTWVEKDTGLANGDLDKVRSIVVDASAAAAGNVIWAAVEGPGRVYKTTDAISGSATWAQAAGSTTDFTKRIPNKARVHHVFVTKQDPNTVFAATTIGLYKTSDGGTTWTLAGFQGRDVRSVAQSGVTTLLVVGVADSVGLYRTP